MDNPCFFCERILLPEGWTHSKFLTVGPDGSLIQVSDQAPEGPFEMITDPVIPGLVNLHSHAFQRLLVGRTQRASTPQESFWSWRSQMYHLAHRITPEIMEAVAAWLYINQVKSGYTTVGEFHYIHNAPTGQAYHNPALLSEHMIAAL